MIGPDSLDQEKTGLSPRVATLRDTDVTRRAIVTWDANIYV